MEGKVGLRDLVDTTLEGCPLKGWIERAILVGENDNV